jgi:hypothetical protein
MGPLFAALALAILALIGVGVVFAVSLIFVPARLALRFALAAVPGGGVGAILGGASAAEVLGGPRMLGSEPEVLFLLGMIVAGGLLGVAAAIWLAARYRIRAANP